MNLKDFYNDKLLRAVAVFLALVITFTSGTFIGVIINPKGAGEATVESGTVGGGTAVSTTPQSSSSSLSSSNTESTITEDTKSEMTTAEILALFNESANKIKTDAVKVIKNYEDRTHMEEHLIVPEILTKMAADILATSFKDDTDPIVYATKDEIIANFQVPGQTWVSQLTEAEVADSKCVDIGTEYELYIKLHPTTNPEPGNGVAKAFDTITSSEVMESAPPMVKDFSTEYFDCIIRCKIDKESKNITWINYSSPLILKLKVEFFGKLDAQVGLKFEKDYTIEY